MAEDDYGRVVHLFINYTIRDTKKMLRNLNILAKYDSPPSYPSQSDPHLLLTLTTLPTRIIVAVCRFCPFAGGRLGPAQNHARGHFKSAHSLFSLYHNLAQDRDYNTGYSLSS